MKSIDFGLATAAVAMVAIWGTIALVICGVVYVVLTMLASFGVI